MFDRWLYRSRQFFAALTGRVTEGEMAEARLVLGPALYPIFAALPGQYRHHAFKVYRRVRVSGCEDRALWQAALLHDSGKYDPVSGRYVTTAHRAVVVLLETVKPGRQLLAKLASPVGKSKLSGVSGLLRYPFYLGRHHAALGAERARQHAADPQVVELIAAHHKHGRHASQHPALLALQAADDKS
ncbi:MAG: hypothetical protein IVW55_13115 [Chloroflexi bacterium]|nr:hypothetical protein [Chloroflexota bacterium]